MSSEVFRVGVLAHETLQFQAGADLILRCVEYGQRVHEEPPAERGKREVVPDDFGQQNCEVEAVPAWAEKCVVISDGQMKRDQVHVRMEHELYFKTHNSRTAVNYFRSAFWKVEGAPNMPMEGHLILGSWNVYVLLYNFHFLLGGVFMFCML